MEDKICLAQGRTYVFNSSISQFATIALQPSALGDRCIAIADLYALWRPRSVKFKAISLGTGANVVLGHLYPDALSLSPTTMEEVVDAPVCAFGSGLFGSALPTITMEEPYWRKSEMLDWLATTTVPNDNLLENAGLLVYGNENSTFTANNFRGVIEWEFEFKSMVDPQVSLQRLEEKKYPEMFPPLPSANKPEGAQSDSSASGIVAIPRGAQTSQSANPSPGGWVVPGRLFRK